MFLLAIAIFCLLSLLGTAVFYFGTVSALSYSLIFVTVLAGTGITYWRHHRQIIKQPIEKSNWSASSALATIGCLVGLSAWWSTIWNVQIIDSVRSPWLVIAPVSIIALGLCIFFLYGLVTTRVNRFWPIVLILFTFFSAISMATIVYPLGYGFDPFLHRATINHIAEFGTINPKPFYYIGQYALELFGHLIFKIPLNLLDRFFLPITGSALLVGSAWIGLTQTLKTKKSPAILAIFLFPLSALIVTTPQSLAFATTAAIVFLSLPRLTHSIDAPKLQILALLTITTLAIHPLAGIPAIIYLALVCSSEINIVWLRRTVISLFSLAGSISLPLVFIIQAKISGLPISFSLTKILNWSELNLSGFFVNQYNVWFDGLYLVIDNFLFLLGFSAILGFFNYYRQNKNWSTHLPMLMAMICFVNFILMSLTLKFDFLIEYERADYAVRLLTLTTIFLLPHIAFLIHFIDDRIKSESPGMRVAFAGLIALIISANIYGTYPRHDNYARSSGFNVSQNDFDAVRAIDGVGENQEFIVLANQAVSAAAVETYGFKKYYHNDIFYYPIPTGGVMYEYFLAMNEAPSRKIIEQALDTADVDLAFFVVNNYWWQSEKIIENTKNISDDWFAVGDVTIFKFIRYASQSPQ